jgi:molybdate transport system ATP-binding protein
VSGSGGIGVRLERVSLELGATQVLRDLTLELAPATKWLLIGANGAGKSQFLKLLAGERWPTPSVHARRSYRDAAGEALTVAELKRCVQLVSAERQDKYLRYDWDHKVAAVVATGCMASDIPRRRLRAEERRRVTRLLRRSGLWRLRRRRLLTLSYGERRLVMLTRALAARPALLLLDEPYNGLDAAQRRRLDRLLAQLLAAPLTLVVAAHRLADAPAGLRRVLMLARGRLVYRGARRGLPARALAPAPVARRRKQAIVAPAPATPLVELAGVRLYRDYRLVLRDLSLRIEAGEHWAIVGVNGSGKTTLLRFLLGDLPAALGGRVIRRGHARGTPLEAWRRRLGFVSPELQAECLAPASVEELVVSGLRASVGLNSPATPAERRAARAALARVGLKIDPRRQSRELSYGQRRLSLIARALCGRPEALLLDEPFAGLDGQARARVGRLLRRLAAQGVQLIVAAHHREDLPPVIHRVLELRNGRARVRADG